MLLSYLQGYFLYLIIAQSNITNIRTLAGAFDHGRNTYNMVKACINGISQLVFGRAFLGYGKQSSFVQNMVQCVKRMRKWDFSISFF